MSKPNMATKVVQENEFAWWVECEEKACNLVIMTPKAVYYQNADGTSERMTVPHPPKRWCAGHRPPQV